MEMQNTRHYLLKLFIRRISVGSLLSRIRILPELPFYCMTKSPSIEGNQPFYSEMECLSKQKDSIIHQLH